MSMNPVTLEPAAQVALARSGAVVARMPRGVIRVAGPDAESHLQAVLSQELVGIPLGSARYALLLTPKARVLADPRVVRAEPDGFLLDVEPEAAERLAATLTRYRLRAQVEITRADEAWSLLAVAGPEADAVVTAAIGSTPGEVEGSGTGEEPPFALRAAAIGIPRVDLLVPVKQADDLVERLTRAGASGADPTALDALRVAAGVPRLGAEIDERWMPAESGVVERAVSFDKGCYIGQEPVTRLHRRGHANRGPRRLTPAASVRVGEPVAYEGKEVGVVTSIAGSPWLDEPVAMGVVRAEVPAGATVAIGDPPVTATVT